MFRNRAVKGTFIFAFLWATGVVCAQSPNSPDAWLASLEAINQSKERESVKIKTAESLLEAYQQANPKQDSVYARILHRVAEFHHLTGDFHTSIRLLNSAIAINKTENNLAEKSYLVNSYLNMGLYYSLMGFTQEALSYYDSCLTLAENYPDKEEEIVHAYDQLAYIYGESGDYQRSIELADYGLSFARSNENTKQQALLLTQKSNALFGLGDLNQAEACIRQAFSISQNSEIGDRNESVLYTNLGHIQKARGNFNEAIDSYQRAYQINLRFNDPTNAISNLNNLGLIYEDNLGKPDRGKKFYLKALKIAEEIGNRNQMALVLSNLGTLYFYTGKFDLAMSYYQKGIVSLSMGFTDQDWKHNPISDQMKSVSNDQFLYVLLRNKGESLLELYKADTTAKDFLNAALGTFKAADKVVDQMRWKQQYQQSKLYWRSKTKRMYEDAIESAYLLGDMSSAFYFFEKSRAVLLNDKLSELGAQQFLTEEDIAAEKSMRIRTVSQVNDQNPALSDTREEFNDQFLAKQDYEKFVKSLEEKYPSYFRYKYDTAISSLTAFKQQGLQHGQAFVSYFTGEKYIYILAVKADTTFLQRIHNDTYSKNAIELLSITADKSELNQNYPRYLELANALYRQLFLPLDLSEERIIISPDEHFFPFESLIKDKNQPNSFLVKDHAFSYTYSAGFLMKRINNHIPQYNTVLGVAPVNYRTELQQAALLGADFSLRSLEEYFPRVHFLTHHDATKKHFLESVSDYSIVQLYSHAHADSSGEEPVIYFQDDKLYLSELQLMGSLPTQLIVLSACNTGTGKINKGEGVFSFARGFAAAGVPSTVTTLWPVDNQATYQITESFYKFLSKGMPADLALQQAKLDFMEQSEKNNTLPYYWAANILIGKSAVFLPERSNNFLVFVAIAIVLSLLGGFFLKRRMAS